MVKIEEGRFYKTRDGRKVGPMEKPYTAAVAWGDIDKKQYGWYAKNGMAFGTGDTHGRDLISEWPSETKGPIREVRRREIVPGVYGIVRVSVTAGCIDIDVEHDGLTAEQAREASHLLAQIAEVLEESSGQE